MNRKILILCIPVLMAMACRPGAGSPELTGLLGLFLNGGPTGQAALNVKTSNAVTDATRVTLTISGSGITAPIIQNLVKVGTDWTGVIGAIPAGTNRTFLAQAYDASDVLLYQGQATGVTIGANQTASVVIVLQEVSPPPPFTNVAPLIDSLIVSSAQLAQSGTANLNVTAHDPNPGDNITYAWTATAGSFSDASSNNPVYTAPATVGPQTITITVSDQLGATALMNFNVDVQTSFGTGSAIINVGLNTFPVVQNITASPTSFDQNQSTNITLTANDADGDSLTYAWTSTCVGSFADASVQNPAFTADAAAPYGSCNLTVDLDDGRGGTGSGTFGVQIAQSGAANIAPQIVSSFQSALSVNPAGQLIFRVTASDPENTPLSFSWNAASGTAGTPVSTVNGNQTTSEIVWTAPACGSGIQPSVTVTDGDGITSLHNFLPVDINGAATCPQACVDFPASIATTWIQNGGSPTNYSATCTVSGLILTCVNTQQNLTAQYEYPSIQAAAAGNFLPILVATTGTYMGFRGNLMSIDFNGFSQEVTANLDAQWRMLNASLVKATGNETYTHSNFDANGFPQAIDYVGSEANNLTLVNTYNAGETRPAQIQVTNVTTGTTDTANFSNGWVTSAFYGGFNQDFSFTYTGTVSMCAPVPLTATARVSVASDGTPGDLDSVNPRLSGDGRYVVFSSDATNLVPGDTNGFSDVFLHDRQTGTTSMLSLASGGGPADGSSATADITPDGRYVVFESDATNLTAGDTNGVMDIFRRDLQTGITIRVSVLTGGGEANGLSNAPSISDDGRHIAYQSTATNLDPSDSNNRTDIFVYDAQTGTTQTVSVTTSGLPAGDSFVGRISGNGRFVAFHSDIQTITAADANLGWDVFVRDLQTGVSTMVSVTTGGLPALGNNVNPAISSDGRYITFQSNSTSLVSGGSAVESIYVHDRQTATTTRVSVATGGSAANDLCMEPDISADGRYIVFWSGATNLVAGDTNGHWDAFLHDRQTGVTSRFSVAFDGSQGDLSTYRPAISGDGQIGAYVSNAHNLVPEATNGTSNIFVSPL